jgi:excisionase family DNA binding protein
VIVCYALFVYRSAMRVGDDEVLTLKEAHERIDVSVSTLREQAQRGRLKATLRGKTWLVLASEVDRYAREQKGKRGRPRKVKDGDA